MPSPEFRETQDQEVKKVSRTPETQETQEAPMSEDEAREMVENFLKAPETPESLSNLQQIEEKYKTGSLPENIKNLYRKAKEEAAIKLKKDFKDALKQVGVEIEWPSLLEIGEEEAKNLADGIVKNPETRQQVKDVKKVIFDNYATLNPDQKKALDDGLIVFKNTIEKVKKEILPN